MKRSAPLRTRKPLRRRAWLRARGNTKYRRRERDLERMRWTKRQPCTVRVLPPYLFIHPGAGPEAINASQQAMTPCSGPVEADHMGERGLGQKASDDTCAPMCRGHHRDELRAWRSAAIEHNQAAWRNR